MINKYWLLIVFFMFISLFLSVFSGYQLLGESRDYLNYIDFFDYVRDLQSFDSSYRFEPGFTFLIYSITRLIDDGKLIYCFVAGIAIFTKLISFSREERYFFVFFVFIFYYLTRYFVLFEMTVLRAACAFSLAFFVFYSRKNESANAVDVFILMVGILFHYSAVVFVPIYFFNRLSRRRILLFSFFLFLVVFCFEKSILSFLPNYIAVFDTYDNFTKATFLPIPYFIDLIYLVVMFLFWEYNDTAMKYCILGVCVGVAVYFSLLDYSVLASRFRELLSVFILIYVVRAMISPSQELKYITSIYIFLTGFLHVYLIFYYDPLLS